MTLNLVSSTVSLCTITISVTLSFHLTTGKSLHNNVTMSRLLITDGVLFGLTPKEATFVIEYMKDFSPRRAAEAAGCMPDSGSEILSRPKVAHAIEMIITERLKDINIDAEWLLHELVDNHRIARQHGNITASNTALGTLAKHVSIDALAKQKVEIDVVSDRELTDRLIRGRKRMNNENDGEVSFL